MNAIDPDKITMLMQKGVKQIELRGTLHRASVDYAKRKAQAVGGFDPLRKLFNAIAGMSVNDVTPDGLRVGVTLVLDKRKKGFSIGYKKLEKIAVSIIENQQENDEYYIITGDEQKIRPDDIVLHTEVEIASIGKSVVRDEAWEALLHYYNDLAASGRLEQ